ncbi:SMI1/KNR4 family protein [Caenimonas soli]|uniref:SMI1/KNR4 family protein n=1 Tax=Caenimonas soli TaxID=2735555 RepID=UPI0015532725|nr:SMI1/KNR4 family protein [Caenimonas soli]NPC58672.1 SMI1/KNR4 family protein [Caenimonas soli]
MAFPTTVIHVAAAERELGVKLPREYRERLMARNGGELSTAGDDWQVFPVFDATNRKTAGRSAGHIVLETRSARAWEGFPQGAVAIASNGAGDLLVLLPMGTPGQLDPQVQVWNHETRKCKPSALRYDH